MSTAIEWTHIPGTRGETWNPVVGCSRVSEGCRHCYAEVMAKRLVGMGVEQYGGVIDGNGRWSGKVNLVESALVKPFEWKGARTVFVNSMSDLFHERVPFAFTDRVFGVMALCPQHVFQILTKRPRRMLEYFNSNGGPDELAGVAVRWRDMAREWKWTAFEGFCSTEFPLSNVWMGVSVESDTEMHRVDYLQETAAAVRFLSLEPLLGRLGDKLRGRLGGIDWVIVGGESGAGARAMHPDWVREIRDVCGEAGVQFFFKQWGAWAPDDAESPRGKASGWCSPVKHTKPVLREISYRHRGVAKSGEVLAGEGFAFMSKVGKKRAGAELDGRAWREWPLVVSS